MAVISLMNTIDSVCSPSCSSSFAVGPFPEIVGPAYAELMSLQEILKRLDCSSKHGSRKKVNALDAEIREVVWRFEDKLESHISNQFLLQCEESNSGAIDLQDLRQDVRSFVEMTKRMEVEYVDQLTSIPEEEDDDEVMTSRIGFSVSKPTVKMVGFSDLFNLIKDGIASDNRFYTLAFAGMAGVGKTTLVNELFNDKMVWSYFDCRAWVKVGRKFLLNEIARDILAQSEYPVTEEELEENGIAFYFK